MCTANTDNDAAHNIFPALLFAMLGGISNNYNAVNTINWLGAEEVHNVYHT